MMPSLFSLKIDQVLKLFFLAAAGLMLSAFVIEHGFGAKPCEMCWQQRYAHWAIGFIAFFGAAMPSEKFKRITIWLIILACAVGLWVAVHQTLGQFGLVELSCKGDLSTSLASSSDLLAALQKPQDIPNCSDWGFTILGMTLAMWNVLVMSSFIVFLLKWLWVNKK